MKSGCKVRASAQKYVCCYYSRVGHSEKCFILPRHVDVSSIFIDESGSRNSRGGFFVVGFVKVRDPAILSRKVRSVRQRHSFNQEIHFSRINKRSLDYYFDLVETLAAENVRVGGSVYDCQVSFNEDRPTWLQQAEMATRLVVGNVNRGELVNVFLDLVQTPEGNAVAQLVKEKANKGLRARAVLEAYDLDSRSTDMLQLADIVAGSINFERKKKKPETTGTPKARVAARLRRALELESFDDIQEGKVNILTFE